MSNLSRKTQRPAQGHLSSLDEMGRRFADAWRRAEQGEQVCETRIAFLDLETMLVTPWPRRLALLRHVRQHGATNIRELAAAIGRDHESLSQDVAALQVAGLLLRDGNKLSAPWEEVRASVALLPAT
jgi:predicted transcriptional regulator